MTRDIIEKALAESRLWAAMRNGRWWVLRRSGATKMWKRKPGSFEIPVRCGLRSCVRITNVSHVAFTDEPAWKSAEFVISNLGIDPNVLAKYPTEFEACVHHAR